MSGTIGFRLPPGAVKELTDIPLRIKQRSGKPVVAVLPSGPTDVGAVSGEEERRRVRDYYLSVGIPAYQSLDRAARAISNMIRYYERAEK